MAGIGFGFGLGFGGFGLGAGVGFGCRHRQGLGGFGYGGGLGTSGSVGSLPGVTPSCVGQLPPSQVVIQPPCAVVTVPGPVLTPTCQPVAVGGFTSCAPSAYGYNMGRFGPGGDGLYRYGGYGGYGSGWRRPLPARQSLLAGSIIYGCGW